MEAAQAEARRRSRTRSTGLTRPSCVRSFTPIVSRMSSRTRELHKRLSALSAEEQEVWVIDAEINDRGILIDAPLAMAASRLVAKALA